MTRAVGVALLGLGNVGGGVVKLLAENATAIEARLGARIEVRVIAVRDPDKAKRVVDVDRALLTTDLDAAIRRPDVDLVCELIGGTTVAKRAVLAAIAAGKHVITANKALLAEHGAEVFGAAEAAGVDVYYEAAVCGGVPIIRVLREGLASDRVEALWAIVNGTSNYILSTMTETRRPFADILREAQALGYAEADPALDVGGGDTAHKLALLASLAFGTAPDLKHMHVEGIAHITQADIGYAREFGYRIKLLGVARRVGGGIEQRVQPAMVRAGTPLGAVDGAFNAVAVDAGEAGPFFFEGRGAGEGPTASAVIADIVDIALGSFEPAFGKPAHTLTPLVPAPEGTAASAYYLRFDVLDIPGVVAEIAGRLAEAQVSIESMLQRGRNPGEAVSIVMITHETPQLAVARALKSIATSDKVLGAPSMIPMETG